MAFTKSEIKNTLEAHERERYSQQEKKLGIIAQLNQQGYVETNHLFTDEDMTQLFSYLSEQDKISCTDPISVTEDNGEVLAQALDKNKKAGRLLIPANLYNRHWVLLIRDQDNEKNKVTLRCWNSLSKPEEELPIKKVEGVLQRALQEAYASSTMQINVESVYTGEQKDNVSCGPRVAQKAYRLADLKNDLTDIPMDNSSLLCYQAIKKVAKRDDEFTHELNTVVQEVGQLVYSEKNYKENPTLKGIVDDTKNYQETLDENLAIELQEVYIKDPEIDSEDAFNLAKQQLSETNYRDVSFERKQFERKQEITAWVRDYFNIKSPKSNFACKQKTENAGDDGELNRKSPLTSF